jgi:two-component system, OmpR family, copper resistance phosphate regulon response regulator CusR
MNILLIEDDTQVASFIKKGLNEQGYIVTMTYDGQTGKSIAVEQEFDLVILDVMLPLFNGYEVCKYIKQEKEDLPVLMLTALGTVQNKIEGFESGADDYLPKPFHFDELIARIKALVRRQKAIIQSKTHTIADLVIDLRKKSVSRAGKEILLTAKEYTLLELMMANQGRILSRTFIMESVWGINFNRGTNLIDVYINYLRTKIDKDHSKKLIHTIVGMGYVLKD